MGELYFLSPTIPVLQIGISKAYQISFLQYDAQLLFSDDFLQEAADGFFLLQIPIHSALLHTKLGGA